MPRIDCFEHIKGNKKLEAHFASITKDMPENEQRAESIKLANEYYKILHSEVNDLNKLLRKKQEPLTVTDNSKEIENIKESYAEKIEGIKNEAKESPSSLSEDPAEVKINELLNLLNDGRKGNDVFEVKNIQPIQGKQNLYNFVKAENKKGNAVFNLVSEDGKVFDGTSPNWRNESIVKQDIRELENKKNETEPARNTETIISEVESATSEAETIVSQQGDWEEVTDKKRLAEIRKKYSGILGTFGAVTLNSGDNVTQYKEEDGKIYVKESKSISASVEKIDSLIDEIDSKLTLLGYYDSTGDTAADMRENGSKTPEKKFKKDLVKFSKELAKILGYEHDVILDKKGKVKSTEYANTNIAPIGGDGTIILWKPNSDYGVYISISADADLGNDSIGSYGNDTLRIKDSFMWRSTSKGDKYGGFSNQWAGTGITASELAKKIKVAVDMSEKVGSGKRTEATTPTISEIAKADPTRIIIARPDNGVKPTEEAPKEKFIDDEEAQLLANFKSKFKAKFNSGIAFDPEEEARKDIEILTAGSQLMKYYIRKGVKSFQDIADRVIEHIGDATDNLISSLQKIYLGETLDHDDLDTKEVVRNYKPKNISHETESGNAGSPMGENSNRLDAGQSQSDVQSDARDREARMGDNESGSGNQNEGQSNGGPKSIYGSSGGVGIGGSIIPINGNESINQELGGSTQEQEIDSPSEQTPVVSQLRHNGNFVIPTDFVNAKSFSVAQKLQDNINAIKVLITLSEEQRKATPEEQNTLFKYVGWGGIKEIGFKPDSNSGWTKSNSALKPKIQEVLDLLKKLDEKNYDANLSAIKRSTQNAHYTAIPIIRAMYNVIRHSGFKGGSILEPSAGIGNFIGAMPIDIMDNSKIAGIELDNITGLILKNLYPNAVTKIDGYEKVQLAPNTVDLVISNIPFGNVSVFDESFNKSKNKTLKGSQKKIHSYFFARAMQDAKPNGIVAFVTSTGIMDSKDNKDLRAMMADQAEFMGAIRLPNDSFKGNANTSVVTDIIFLRKFAEGEEKIQKHSFENTALSEVDHKSQDKKYTISYNEYFLNNPQMVLGKFEAGGLYAEDEMTVSSTGINLEEAISNLGSVIFPNKIDQVNTETNNEIVSQYINGEGHRPGNIVKIKDGEYGIYTDDIAVNEELDSKAWSIGINPNDIRSDNLYDSDYERLTKAGLSAAEFKINKVNPVNIAKKYAQAIEDLIPLRQALNKVYAAEYADVNESMIAQSKNELKLAYDKFVKNSGTLLLNKNLLELDIDGHNLKALEIIENKKVVGLADIFTKRVFERQKRAESAENISDAVSINLSETGGIDINRIAELLKITPEEVIEQGAGLIFKNPKGGFETKDRYLSGNVRRKLEEAEIAAQEDKFYQANVEALKNVQPLDLEASQIYAPISAPWINKEYLQQFASEIFHQNITIQKLSTGKVSLTGFTNTQVTDVYGTSRMNGIELFEEAAQNRMPIVKDTIRNLDGSTTQVINEKATQLAIEKVNKIIQAFGQWIWNDDKRRNDITEFYNKNFNNTVLRKYDGSHLKFDGYAGIHQPRQHQMDGIWMVTQQMGGILDHIVGSGKTLLMVLSAMKMKQMGLVKKPIIIGLKANASEIANTYKESFPMAKVLYPKETDFTPDRRREFFAKMANNDWDAIVMTHDQFGKIKQSKQIQEEVFINEITALENDIISGKANNLSKRDLNGLEVRKQNLEVKLQALANMDKDEQLKSFDEMGIDFMFIDESQQFKNLTYSTIQRGVSGLGSPKGSAKSLNVLFAIRTLQKMYGADKGTVFASGTPISNTMVEMYLLFKYLRPNKMQEMGLNSFDQWANTFARVGSEIEFGVTNSLKPKVRMREFMNVPEMAAMYREIADVRNDSNLYIPKPVFKKTTRVKANMDISNGENISINGNSFKVLGRIKGIEKNEYWVSLMSIGNDVKIPKDGVINYEGKEIQYSDTEYTDGLLVNIAPSLQQQNFAKSIQRFAETKDGTHIGRPYMTDKDKKAYMLLATNLASKMAIDMRLIDPSYDDTETGKIGVAADTIMGHYTETELHKGIQLVFSDLGTPKSANKSENLFDTLEGKGIDRDTLTNIFGEGAYSDKPSYPPSKKIKERIMQYLEYTNEEYDDLVVEANEDTFNVYQDLKNKLVRRGIPANEVVFIHDYKSDKARKELFEDARNGKVRVIIGSTSKLGTGVNVQKKIAALHHLDVPWRPSDMEQRNGRGIRQGNDIIKDFYNNELPIYYYATEATLDAYKYQLLDTKQQFIDQAKTGDGGREISEGDGDEENGVSFAAMTAMLSGNPVILEKAKIDKKVKELDNSKKAFDQEKYSLRDKINRSERNKIQYESDLNNLTVDKETFEKNTDKKESGEWIYKATIDGNDYTERALAGESIAAEKEKYIKAYQEKYPLVKKLPSTRHSEAPRMERKIGEISGFDILLYARPFLDKEDNKNFTNIDPVVIVRSRDTGTVYAESSSKDDVHNGSILQREIRKISTDTAEKNIKLYERDIIEKERYLESLPDVFPRENEYNNAIEQQKRIEERLREMSVATTTESEGETTENIDDADVEFMSMGNASVDVISKPAFDNLVKRLQSAFPSVKVFTDRKTLADKLSSHGAGDMIRQAGKVYGVKFSDGSIYLNSSIMNANAPIHEFSHVWEQYNPQDWAAGIEFVQRTSDGKRLFLKLRESSFYANKTDDQIWSETLNTMIGNKGEGQFNNQSMFQKFGEWLSMFFKKIGDRLGVRKLTPDDKLSEFTSKVLGDLLGGKPVVNKSNSGATTNLMAADYSNEDLMKAFPELDERRINQVKAIVANGHPKADLTSMLDRLVASDQLERAEADDVVRLYDMLTEPEPAPEPEEPEDQGSNMPPPPPSEPSVEMPVSDSPSMSANESKQTLKDLGYDDTVLDQPEFVEMLELTPIMDRTEALVRDAKRKYGDSVYDYSKGLFNEYMGMSDSSDDKVVMMIKLQNDLELERRKMQEEIVIGQRDNTDVSVLAAMQSDVNRLLKTVANWVDTSGNLASRRLNLFKLQRMMMGDNVIESAGENVVGSKTMNEKKEVDKNVKAPISDKAESTDSTTEADKKFDEPTKKGKRKPSADNVKTARGKVGDIADARNAIFEKSRNLVDKLTKKKCH